MAAHNREERERTIITWSLMLLIIVFLTFFIGDSHAQSASRTGRKIETFTYYLTEELIKNYDDAFDFYMVYDGGTDYFKRCIDLVRPLGKQIVITEEYDLDANGISLLEYKYNISHLNYVFTNKIFPEYDPLYNDPMYKPFIRGIIIADEIPLTFNYSFDAIYRYDAYFYAEHGFHLNKTDLDLNERGIPNNPARRQIFYQWLRKSYTEALNNIYDKFKERYPEWEIYQEPYMEEVLGLFSVDHLTPFDIENLKADGIFTTWNYAKADESNYLNKKVYWNTRYIKSIRPDIPVYVILRNHVKWTNPNVSNSNQILFDAMLAYLAGADGIGYFSIDYSEIGERPVYNSSLPMSEERWNATYSICKFLRNRSVMNFNRDILVIYPYYSIAVLPWSNYYPLKSLGEITRGFQYDLLPSKYVIEHPEVLDNYKIIFIFEAKCEPEKLLSILNNTEVPVLFDSHSFFYDEYMNATACNALDVLMGVSEKRREFPITKIYMNGTVIDLGHVHWDIYTIKHGDWETSEHNVLALFNDNCVALLRYKYNFFAGVPFYFGSCEGFNVLINFIFESIFNDNESYIKNNTHEFIYYTDEDMVVLSNRNNTSPYYVDFTLRTKDTVIIYNFNRQNNVQIRSDGKITRIYGNVYSTIVIEI